MAFHFKKKAVASNQISVYSGMRWKNGNRAAWQQSRTRRERGIGAVEWIKVVGEAAFLLAVERRRAPGGAVTPLKAAKLSKSNGALPAVRTAPGSTGVGRAGGIQAHPEGIM